MTNKKANAKEMTLKEINGMTVTLKTDNGEKTVKLVNFVTDTEYIDTSVKVDENYKHPFAQIGENLHPIYYVAQLAVTFKADAKNDTTTKDKDLRKANNAEIMANAVGFKAVCRDLSNLAGEKEKGFLSLKACMPCDKGVNPNGAISGLWVFTSKKLREDFLKMVQVGILEGKYQLADEAKPKKRSVRIERIAKAFGISYEEAKAKMEAVK